MCHLHYLRAGEWGNNFLCRQRQLEKDECPAKLAVALGIGAGGFIARREAKQEPAARPKPLRSLFIVAGGLLVRAGRVPHLIGWQSGVGLAKVDTICAVGCSQKPT